MSNNNDADKIITLVQRAKQGDADAFGVLYTFYFTPVYRYVYLRIGDKGEADDIAQNVFVKAWSAITRYEDTGKPFLAWLFTIARNTVIDYYRKHKPTIREDLDTRLYEESNITDQDEERERAEKMNMIRNMLGILSSVSRDVIILKFIEGRSYREIAFLVGKKEDAVRAIASRGIRKIREQIEAHTDTSS